MSEKKLISIVTACYNEEGDIEELQSYVSQVMSEFPEYNYEHIF